MDRASLFFLTKGIVTQCFPLLITSLAICKSILQQLIHDFNAQSKLHSCLLFQREGWLSFIKKKGKKQNRYFVPSKPSLRSTNFKIVGISSSTNQLYFGCILFWNFFFRTCYSFRIPEMNSKYSSWMGNWSPVSFEYYDFFQTF